MKPLLEQALTSSESTERQLSETDQQSKLDAEQRTKERADSDKRYEEQLSRAEGLQTFFDKLFPLLTDFSGSEAEKQARALAATQKIKDDAVTLERQRDFWRSVGIGGAVVTVLAIIVAVVK